MHTQAKMNPVAAVLMYGVLGLVVLAFVVISGIANVNVWWNSAEGWAQYLFTTIGIGAEAWGAVGLLLMTRRFFQRQWLKALICFALWTPAVAFNGYSTYRFFVIEGAQVSGEGAITRTTLTLAQERIPEITDELEVIGVTRTPEAITAERDRLPDNYRTRRAELDAELATAERRAALETELAEKRATVLNTVGAAATPDEKTISDNRIWVALVIWMEAIKALALWVMFGRTERRTDALEASTAETPPEPVKRAPDASSAQSGKIIVLPDGEERQVLAL